MSHFEPIPFLRRAHARSLPCLLFLITYLLFVESSFASIKSLRRTSSGTQLGTKGIASGKTSDEMSRMEITERLWWKGDLTYRSPNRALPRAYFGHSGTRVSLSRRLLPESPLPPSRTLSEVSDLQSYLNISEIKSLLRHLPLTEQLSRLERFHRLGSVDDILSWMKQIQKRELLGDRSTVLRVFDATEERKYRAKRKQESMRTHFGVLEKEEDDLISKLRLVSWEQGRDVPGFPELTELLWMSSEEQFRRWRPVLGSLGTPQELQATRNTNGFLQLKSATERLPTAKYQFSSPKNLDDRYGLLTSLLRLEMIGSREGFLKLPVKSQEILLRKVRSLNQFDLWNIGRCCGLEDSELLSSVAKTRAKPTELADAMNSPLFLETVSMVGGEPVNRVKGAIAARVLGLHPKEVGIVKDVFGDGAPDVMLEWLREGSKEVALQRQMFANIARNLETSVGLLQASKAFYPHPKLPLLLRAPHKNFLEEMGRSGSKSSNHGKRKRHDSPAEATKQTPAEVLKNYMELTRTGLLQAPH